MFITGASKGLGKATAISYAQAGASGIALGARSSLEPVVQEVLQAAKSAGHPEPRITTVNLDVTNRESVDAAAKQVSQDLEGRIDILINNAGVPNPPARQPLELGLDQIRHVFEINTFAPIRLTQLAVPAMIKRGWGRIIFISTSLDIMMAPAFIAYGMSKACDEA